jgi:hypothetical protein
VAGAAVLLLAGLVPLRRSVQASLAAVGAIVASLAVLSGITVALQGVALLGAVVFPTLAFVIFPQPVAAFEEHEHAAVRRRDLAIVAAAAEFAAIGAVTLCGAVTVAAVLSELPFMVKVASFAGIKAATVLPVLLVGGIYLTGMSGEYPTWAAERAAVAQRLRRFLDEPVRVGHSLLLVAGVAALALVVMRSGNEPGVGVSEVELRFRAVLDRVLGVRPRTKEFLVGHPALILALAAATSARSRGWAFGLMLAGIIGQVGMLNSFCHLHTPLRLTAIRTFHGLWIGALIGGAAVWLWVRCSRETRSGG